MLRDGVGSRADFRFDLFMLIFGKEKSYGEYLVHRFQSGFGAKKLDIKDF